MPREMTKRERVEAAMNLQEVDRVPLYDLLYNDAVIEHFSGERLPRLDGELPPDEEERQIEEGLRITCKAIGKMLDMTRSIGGPVRPRRWVDKDGFTIVSTRWTSWVEGRPFGDLPGLAGWMAKVISRMKERTREIRTSSEFREATIRDFLRLQAMAGDTVIVYWLSGTGLDDLRQRAGWELFSYLCVDDPGIISEFLETYTEMQVAIAHSIADPSLSPVVLTYGDIASKGRLMHSPGWLRREFFPRLKRINDAWHEHGFKCLFHSDGYLMDVLDDLMASGIDGLNPIEVTAGMSIREVRKRVGDRLFLAGGIDVSQLMAFGSPEEVRGVCLEAIREAGPGYLMGSTTELDNGARLENVLAMVEVARRGLCDA